MSSRSLRKENLTLKILVLVKYGVGMDLKANEFSHE